MPADPGFVGLPGSAKDSVNHNTEFGTNVNGLKWLLINCRSAQARAGSDQCSLLDQG